MKLLTIFLVVLIIGSCASSQKTYKSDFNYYEISFIKNVIRIVEEKPTSVSRRSTDSHIVLEFPTEIWILRHDGYVDSVYELRDGEWYCYGPKEDAF